MVLIGWGLVVLAFIAGGALGLYIGFNQGVDSATRIFRAGMQASTETGQHFIEKYVAKLTPDDLAKFDQRIGEYIDEDSLHALDIDEDKYRELMGWKSPRNDPDPDY